MNDNLKTIELLIRERMPFGNLIITKDIKLLIALAERLWDMSAKYPDTVGAYNYKSAREIFADDIAFAIKRNKVADEIKLFRLEIVELRRRRKGTIFTKLRTLIRKFAKCVRNKFNDLTLDFS